MPRRPFLASVARAAFVAPAVPATLLITAGQFRAQQPIYPEIVLDDPEGVLGRTRAPASATVVLPGHLRQAAMEGRLELRERSAKNDPELRIPVQCLTPVVNDRARLCWLVPAGNKGRRVFVLQATAQSSAAMTSVRAGGEYEIVDRGKTVLRYNYSTVEPGEVLKLVSEENRKYAVARSDYIHPLYGPYGETLTRDWPVDHPHHRGIYWAWPEVDWRHQRADLHALQNVFARPTGKCEMVSGAVFAELKAENLWQWNDREPIVRELVTIRAYAGDSAGRLVDLELYFEALREPVLLARRGTTHYGGLNVRLGLIHNQQSTKRVCPPAPTRCMAWADISGSFAGAAQPVGLTMVQLASNPDYPGDWVEYPELNWLQPTFPAHGTRYEISQGKALSLRFRLQIHTGSLLSEEAGDDCWRAANLFEAGKVNTD